MDVQQVRRGPRALLNRATAIVLDALPLLVVASVLAIVAVIWLRIARLVFWGY